MTWMTWYDHLAKPSWTPPPSTISLIWSLLYPVILVSFGWVFVQAGRGKIPGKVVIPFAINLVANVLFMPVFVGLKSLPLASLDILLTWSTIIWAFVAIWPHRKWVALAQVPYFLWVTTASILQLSITALNLGTA